jgi:hypothetical protein
VPIPRIRREVVTDTSHLSGYGRVMDETARILGRLQRIDELKAGGSPAELLAELRALVPDAERWARAEGDERARAAAARLREEAGEMR